MNTSTYNIPIELNTTGGYTLAELKDKLMAYALTLVNTPKESVKVNKTTHSDWVKSMAKYRRLDSIDEKEALMEALDERFK